jgi:acetyl-CoA carboxylase biotin carboxyl carrier protein
VVPPLTGDVRGAKRGAWTVPELSFAEVGEILLMVQCIEGADVEVEWGDLRIQVHRGGDVGSQPKRAAAQDTDIEVVAGATTGQGAGEPGAATGETPVGAPADAPSHDGVAVRVSAHDDIPEHWVAVTAPLAGTVYRAPRPDEPPYVEVGDPVSPGDTVALVEVMKLFTELKSEVSGKVARIDAEDSSLVEFGQSLIWIEPA